MAGGRAAIARGDYASLRTPQDISAEVERLSAEAGYEVNAERVNDLAKRLLHRLVARRLPCEPDLLARARERVAEPGDGLPRPDYVPEWHALLELPVADLRRRITERGEEMDRLRSSSPLFDGNYADEGLRRRIWRAARRIASMRDHRNAVARPQWGRAEVPGTFVSGAAPGGEPA